MPVAYFAAENRFSSLRALPTASFMRGLEGLWPKPGRLDRSETTQEFHESNISCPRSGNPSRAPRSLRETGPPNTCVQLSAVRLGVLRRSLGGFVTRHADDQEPGIAAESRLDVLHRRYLAEARWPRGPEFEQDKLAACSLNLNWPPSR